MEIFQKGRRMIKDKLDNINQERRPKVRFSTGTCNASFIFRAMGCRFP